MRKTTSRKLTLNRVETFVFFACILSATALEGVFLYWLGVARVTSMSAGIRPANLFGQWTSATLPHRWLVGALLVRLCRVAAMVVLPQIWGQAEVQSNHQAFLRLRYSTNALVAFEIGALDLDHSTTGVD